MERWTEMLAGMKAPAAQPRLLQEGRGPAGRGRALAGGGPRPPPRPAPPAAPAAARSRRGPHARPCRWRMVAARGAAARRGALLLLLAALGACRLRLARAGECISVSLPSAPLLCVCVPFPRDPRGPSHGEPGAVVRPSPPPSPPLRELSIRGCSGPWEEAAGPSLHSCSCAHPTQRPAEMGGDGVQGQKSCRGLGTAQHPFPPGSMVHVSPRPESKVGNGL